MKNILLKTIRFPFDLLFILYINFKLAKNVDLYLDFEDFYSDVEKQYYIWVENFNYPLAVLFYLFLILLFVL